MEYCLDEGISLSTISQRRMSASFDRRLPSSLERRLSGQGKQHLGHRERAVDRVSLALGPCDSFTESSWSEVWTPAPEAAQNTEVGVQTERKETDRDRIEEAEEEDGEFEQVPRDVAECLRVMNAAADTETGTKSLLDSEIISLVEKKHIPGHQLEKALGDPSRGVRVRRKIYMKHGNLKRAMESLPYQHYDYSKVILREIYLCTLYSHAHCSQVKATLRILNFSLNIFLVT